MKLPSSCEWILTRVGSFSFLATWADSVGYIDLSKRRVSAEEMTKCEELYEKGKTVDSIITQVARKQDVDADKLYEQVAWPLSRQYGHSYEAFKLSITLVVSSTLTTKLTRQRTQHSRSTQPRRRDPCRTPSNYRTSPYPQTHQSPSRCRSQMFRIPRNRSHQESPIGR